MRNSFITSALLIGLVAASNVFAQQERPPAIEQEATSIDSQRCPFPDVLRIPGGTPPAPVLSEFPSIVRPLVGGSVWNQTVADKAFGHTFRYPVATPNECCVITGGKLIINIKALQDAQVGGAAAANDGINVYSNGGVVGQSSPWASGAPIGSTKPVTFSLSGSALTSGLLSFYVQDDTAVLSAELVIERCCLRKPCSETTLDISTGSNNGVAIAIGASDSHWTVQPPAGGVAQAVAINPGATSWVGPPPPTRWISSSPTATALGQYVYRFNFDLGREWPNRDCRLSLRYAVDNDMTMQIDNNAPFATTAALPNAFSHFNALNPAATTVVPSVGPHALTVKVTNTSGPSGLLIAGRIVCTCKRGPAAAATATQ